MHVVVLLPDTSGNLMHGSITILYCCHLNLLLNPPDTNTHVAFSWLDSCLSISCQATEYKYMCTHTQMAPTMEQLEALKIEPSIYPTLGSNLKIEADKLNEISRNTTHTEDCLREMYRVWLEKGSDVSWETLAQALEKMHLYEKASEIRREYIPGSSTKQDQ